MFYKNSSTSFCRVTKFRLPGGGGGDEGEHTYITSLSSLKEGIPGCAFSSFGDIKRARDRFSLARYPFPVASNYSKWPQQFSAMLLFLASLL